ncbi:hypothetical protein J3L16_13155 [Alteromonas sp. 5E99-2]|uniref:hypothetical protein n=1 Tax=Alteromonas sp. 5E99-2 TaxID=2817683 RepID=UPI001A99BF96|nr:hypothetical protein [Alteromonas sp. 5E99-2]MBO1256635.1 hypothetical protein [Alteromonas sp. 5E99-2]
MNVKDEIEFRLSYLKGLAQTRPNMSLPGAKVANRYRSLAGVYYGIYIYETALSEKLESRNNTLMHINEMSLSAVQAHSESTLKSLEAVFLARTIKLEDVTDIAKQIVSLASSNTNEYITHLFTVISCLKLGCDYTPYLDWFSKMESKKYTLVLPGSVEAISHLVKRDENSLSAAIDSMLLAHHKEANNRHSDIYNSQGAFLSIAPYLIVDLAESFGMNIRSKITENKQILKLGLSSPADFPEIPKNHKMPIEVDYLTAKTNIVV